MTLKKTAEQFNEPLETLIPRIVREEGSITKAAHRLGVYPNALQYWMRTNGYRLITRQVADVVKESAPAR